VILQFTPAIRQTWRLVHRINGYIIILLALIANVGAIMIAREAFGGTLATQSWIGALFILTTVGLGLAIYNVKMLQIDQHRAWMLRTWFYVRLSPINFGLHVTLANNALLQFSSIITLRIIMIIAAQIVSAAGDFWAVQNCSKLLDVIGDAQTLVEQYPTCASLINDGNLNAVAAVNANFGGSAVELMSAMNISFGMAGWIATTLHAIGVEVYVSLSRDTSSCAHLLTSYSSTLLPKNPSVFARCHTNDRWKRGSRMQAMRAWSHATLLLRLWRSRQGQKRGRSAHCLATCLRQKRHELLGRKHS